ncbi:AMP-binding protein [Sneathiella chungangensis]|uniref:acetate--CoA ligase n=1 Tax=Sneathiella chungangensis TaxID=1418234 RepID=A0A845MGI8_9PROT|nr:AMP-binding protein [Sneathiella chungangensis]MZR22791.1 AMP-binding protein [Sneathiella chungangensis]
MNRDDQNTWYPSEQQIEQSQIMKLCRHLNLESYDALYEFSLCDPDAYWRGVNDFCKIQWSTDYQRYLDLSRGIEFPSWFTGGELNWVDTILDNGFDDKKTAIISETEKGAPRKITYADLRDEVKGVAAGLLSIGVRRGDRIGLLMENGIDASVAFIALSYIGAIVVPLFSGFGPEAIVARLDSCQARGIITSNGFHRRGQFVDVSKTVSDVCNQLDDIEFVVIKPSSDDIQPMPDQVTTYSWDEIKQPLEAAPPSSRMAPNDPFMVIFTSGTTGKPKGIVHVHGGFPIKIAHDAVIHFDVGAEDVFCWPADMGWIAGSLVLCTALMRGATLVCYDGAPDFPDWSRLPKLVERYRITHFGSAPTLIRGFFANHDVYANVDMSSIRLLITAGETIAPEHFLWFERVFGRGEAPLINYTGGTEVSGALLGSVVVRPIVPAGFNSRSPGIEIDVVDASGTPVQEQPGELAVRAPFVGMTASFWRDEERYLDTYWRTIPGMWIHGDLAMRDGEGNYFILGRSDDTLKVAGKRVGPAEIEEILIEIDGVMEAAVIGVDDPVKGQAIVAFIVCFKQVADIGQLVAMRVREQLGKPFVPSAVIIVSQLPKTRSSKIMRRVIRSAYSGMPKDDISSIVNPESIDEIELAVKNR